MLLSCMDLTKGGTIRALLRHTARLRTHPTPLDGVVVCVCVTGGSISVAIRCDGRHLTFVYFKLRGSLCHSCSTVPATRLCLSCTVVGSDLQGCRVNVNILCVAAATRLCCDTQAVSKQ